MSCLSACATLPVEPLTIEDALNSDVAISVPIKITEKGLIVIKGVSVEGQSLDMVLDTGATQSAIFESALRRLNIESTSERRTMVHGMLQSAERRVLSIDELEIGSLSFLNKNMVILNDHQLDDRTKPIHDGLIGMDILAGYKLYISPEAGELRLIPNITLISIPYSWQRIELVSNPFQDDNRTLNFMYIRIAGRNTPTLLDTGAEFSAMNWPAASFSQAKAIRRRLRENWELQGAIGLFKPIAKLKIERLRGGQMFWEHKDFIVMDLESLNVLGIAEQPFMIAGMNLFREETFLIDFENNFVAIEPR